MKKYILSQSILVLMTVMAREAYSNDDFSETVSCKDQNWQEECEQDEKNFPSVTFSPVTLTANRNSTKMVDYVGQVSVLEEKDLIKDTNIIKNLSQIPGVELGYDYGRQIGSQYKIRGYGYGSNNRVIIEQDGVKRDTSLYSNHISSFRTDPNLLKRVEVVKGGSSVLHGSGAIGGIVSMQTKDVRDFISKDKQTGVTIGARYDSNNSFSQHVALAIDPKTSPFNGLIYYRQQDIDDIKLADNGNNGTEEAENDEKIKTGFVKLGWNINDANRIAFSYYDFDEKLNTTWQTLYHLDVDDDDPVKGHLEQKDAVLTHNYQSFDNPLVDLETKVYKSEATYDRSFDKSNPKGNFYINEDNRWGLNTKNVADFEIGKFNHNLVAGLDYQDRDNDSIMYIDGDINDFGSGMPNYLKDLGFYIQDEISYGKLTTTLGARYDNFRRSGKDTNNEYKDSNLSPKASIGYEVVDGVYLLAGYSETFRAPTPNETSSNGPLNPYYWYLPNYELEAENLKEYEIGFAIDKQNTFTSEDDLYLKATYFDGQIEDMISFTKMPGKGKPPAIDKHFDLRQYGQYINVDSVSRKGVEVEGLYSLKPWQLGIGYGRLEIVDDATNERESPTTQKVYTNFGYEDLNTGLGVNLKLTHWFKPIRDDYKLVSWGTEYQYIKDDYTIADFSFSWDPVSTGYKFLDNDFKFNFGINNIFDDQRLNPNSVTTTTRVGNARNFYAGIEKRF